VGGAARRDRRTASSARSTALFEQLAGAIPNVTAELLPGLNHLGPEKAPDVVAERIREHLTGRSG
jgi:hypothetical protein